MARTKSEQHQAIIEDALALLQQLVDELTEIQDNTPENLQGSTQYEKRDDAIDALDNAISEIGAIELWI